MRVLTTHAPVARTLARASAPHEGATAGDSLDSAAQDAIARLDAPAPNPVTRAALGLSKKMADAGPARWGLATGAATAAAQVLVMGVHPAAALIYGTVSGALQAFYAHQAAEYQASYQAGQASDAFHTPVSPAVSSTLLGTSLLLAPLVDTGTYLALQVATIGVDLALSKILGDDALAAQPRPENK